jgi:hypothetical protein
MNNKFDVMNEIFAKIDGQLDAKINLLISSKDVHGFTFSAENNKNSDILIILHIPKIVIGASPVNHIHSCTTVGREYNSYYKCYDVIYNCILVSLL